MWLGTATHGSKINSFVIAGLDSGVTPFTKVSLRYFQLHLLMSESTVIFVQQLTLVTFGVHQVGVVFLSRRHMEIQKGADHGLGERDARVEGTIVSLDLWCNYIRYAAV
jgi:hypothetical protein